MPPQHILTLGLFLLQAVYSFLATVRVNEAVGNNTKRYVMTAAASDLVKYGITAGLALQAVQGAFLCILTTVLGGMLGNLLGHWFQKRKGKDL